VNVLTLMGTAVANSTVNLYDGATLLGTTLASGSGAWSYTTVALADGSHSLTATDTVAGLTSAASSILAVTIDTTAPVVPTIASFSTDSGTVGDHITNDNTPMLTGTAEANSTVNIYDGATLLGSATANASGAWTYTTAALTDGAHNLTTTDSDAAGNTSAASSALDVTVDSSQSAIAIATNNYILGLRGSALLAGTSEANSSISIHDGNTGALLGQTTASSTGVWSATMGNISNSVHSLALTTTDAAGHTGSANVVYGTTGNDTITSSAANETLFGNGGN